MKMIKDDLFQVIIKGDITSQVKTPVDKQVEKDAESED